MKVWVLQTGEPLHIDSAGLRPMRAMNLSNALIAKGHQVVLWSSDFDHFSKKHRTGKTSTIQYSENLEIRVIASRGYKSHVGLSRLFDHAQLAFNLRKELKSQTPPDVAFVGYPPIETAWVMTNWLTKKKIKFLLDVKDAWPDVLLRAFPTKLQFFARVALSPYFLISAHTFRNATGLSSVTQPFLDWCLKKAKRSQSAADIVAPLTAPELIVSEDELKTANRWLDELGITDSEIVRGSFVGTINSAFNFEPILMAAKSTSVQFVIAGDGPFANALRSRIQDLPNVIMPGWISQTQSKALANRSTFMLAPVKALDDFSMSIPNKFYDAMAHGLPIFTSITGVAKDLIEKEGIGICYSDSDIGEFEASLKKLSFSDEAFLKMSNNSQSLFNNKFSFQLTYDRLIEHLLSLSKKNSNK
jgi:glycosyltransferase involved in cell wall biosynthesis